MKKNIFVILFVLGICFACTEKGIHEFSGETIYLSFLTDASKDSTALSFVTYPSGEIEAKIEVQTLGHWLSSDREFTVSIDPKMTTLPATAYVLPEKCIFGRGQMKDTIVVKFINNVPDMKEKSYRFALKIDESDNVKLGELAFQRSLFRLSDKLECPEWWSRNDNTESNPLNVVVQNYLGKYSEAKYVMFLEELEKDNASFDGMNMAVMKKYAIRLKYRIEAFNNDPENIANGLVPMWDEENNEKMQVPVAG